MRKLLWFSLGFGAACALSGYLLPVSMLLFLSAVFLAAAVILLWFLRENQWGKISGILCLGLTLGFAWYLGYDGIYLSPAREMDSQTAEVTIRASDFSFETSYGAAADGEVDLAGKTYRVRFYVNEVVSLSPGDTVTGRFRFRYTAVGGADAATYHGGDGIFLLAYPSAEVETEPAGSTSWKYAPAYLRLYLLKLLEELFPQDTVAFVKALLMGDTSELDYKTDTGLKLSGIRHVAAVSGLHVSILFSLVYLLTGKRRILTTVIGVPALLIFAAMAGFSPSIIRACVMQLLMLLALSCRKEYDPLTALAFAALVMLVVNPYAITSAGFQLSVGSVAGIFLFSGRICSWLLDPKRLGRWKRKTKLYRMLQKAATSIGVSLGALVLTTPLSAWYFGTVSLVSVVTNLLCLWVITILFCGIIAACVFGAVYMPLGELVAWILAWLVRYVLGISGMLSKFPLAAVYTDSVYITVWLIACYVLLTVFQLSRHKNTIVLFCCAVFSLCIALLASWAEPLLDTYRVTVLDVGQGQCVLLQSEGRTYMVDCGGSHDETTADTAASLLLSQGISHLDGVILTHYDWDHVGAAAYLMGRIGTDVLILPEGPGAAVWEPALTEGQNSQIFRADEDMIITWGNTCITVYAAQDTETTNESSLCVLFQTENCDILITGDRSTAGEAALVRSVQLPKLDALIVGHHGSNSSTGSLLLQVTQPEIALISVGEENAYGHPSPAVLARLESYGCQIRRTDMEGTIILRG